MAARYATFASGRQASDGSLRAAPRAHPQQGASWLSRVLLHWVSPLMRLGNDRHLSELDLWPLQNGHRAAVVAAQFGLHYTATQSIPRSFWGTFAWRFSLAGAACFAAAACSLAGPIVLHHVVGALAANEVEVSDLLLWVLALFVAQTAQALADNYANFDSQLMAIEATGAIKHLIYGKTLRLSAAPRRKMSVAKITTLYTLDCENLVRVVTVAHQLWILPLQIVAVSAMLCWLLGVAALAGIAMVLLLLYMNRLFTSAIQRLQRVFAKFRDERMQRVAETFKAISTIKFNAWEDQMAERVDDARQAEVDCIMHYFRLNVSRTALTAAMPVLISVASLAVYAGVLHRELSPALVFTSLALFQLLQEPLRQVSAAVSTVVGAQVSMARITKFLALSELEEAGIETKRVIQQLQGDGPMVLVNGATFRWGKVKRDVEPVTPLQNVKLCLEQEDFVAIHGPVGCGKSSLCQALLGEMTKLRGDVFIAGSVAYCSQQPWIQNMTLRDNILFGHHFDKQRYDAVLDACALTHDLVSLPAGDRTEIGERGVNLSGGQKARVALARACYANADVYILDAPLAGVDAIVANEIFHKCLLGLLRHKTVLLVTHDPEVLASEHITMAVTITVEGHVVETMPRRTSRPELEGEFAVTPLSPPGADAGADSGSKGPSFARRESSFIAAPLTPENQSETHRLIQKEFRERGRVDTRVFDAYYAAFGGFAVVLFVLSTQMAQQVLQLASSFWLGHWSTQSSSGEVTTAHGLTVYAVLGLVAAVLVFIHTLAMYWFGIQAATALFNKMTHALLHAPMSFFDANPVGRILGRYSEDISNLDFLLPMLFSRLTTSVFSVGCSLLTAAFIIQWKGFLLLPLIVMYVRIGTFYIEPAREIDRYHKTTWSPILSHLAASIEGASVVRAFGDRHVQRFRDLNDRRLDSRSQASFANLAVAQWFQLRIQLLGCGIVFIVVSSLVLLRGSVAPAISGLAFTYVLGLSQNMEQIVQQWSSIETLMVSPERLQEYATIEQEKVNAVEEAVPDEWPMHGAIVFDAVSFKYQTSDELVLRELSFQIQGREKIGVVGRAGAGKSSLTMALFRINELTSGTISIDDVDISKISLKTLREELSIIPQNPVLFKGSLRTNLDPFGDFTDVELWQSISHVGLMGRIGSENMKLDSPVEEEGENFSVGERQMLCMARALLRESRIVIFDEATAAIDHETDQKLQSVIREAFAESTVLTIAHRLDTILDSDRILVLEGGEMVEFASPAELVEKGSGHFFELMEEGGYLDEFLGRDVVSL